MFCTNCRKELPDDTKICNDCGFKINYLCQKEPIVCPAKKATITEHYNNISQKQNEIFNEAENVKPLTTINFFFIQILFLIPILNVFFIVYWSLRKDINANLKAYARSKLIWLMILVVFFGFSLLTLAFMEYPFSFNFRF